jgi:hypothetical protein
MASTMATAGGTGGAVQVPGSMLVQPAGPAHLLLLLLLSLLASESAAWQAAMSVEDVSPTAEQVATNAIFLGGYGALGFRDGLTLGYARDVHDPIMARALYLEDDGGADVLLLVIDAVGIGNVVRAEIVAAAAEASGVQSERIVVAATHTHCGPDLQGMWGGVDLSYRRSVVEGAGRAAKWAAGNKTEALLTVSSLETGSVLTSNRRGWGFTLNATAVLSLRATVDGTVLGTMVNFPAHPTTLGRSVMSLSSDFGGYLCRHLEAASGGAPAMWVNGALGDVSATAAGSGFERPRAYGIAVAEAAIAAVAAGGLAVQGPLAFEFESYQEQITNPVFAAALLLGVLDDYYEVSDEPGALLALTMAARLRLGEQLVAVTTPGESLTRNALPVMEAITAQSASAVPMVFGLVHDSFGYYIPEDEWETGRNGDYEESVAPSREAGNQLRDRLLRLVSSGSGRDHTSAASPPRQNWTHRDAGRLAEAELAVLSLLQARNHGHNSSALGGAVSAAVQVLEMPEPALIY